MPSRLRASRERCAERGRFSRQEVPSPLGHHHLAAETLHGLRQFDPHRPPAEHEKVARYGLHGGRLPVGPDAFELAQAGDRGNEGVSTGGDDDMSGGVAHSVNLDHTRPGQPPAPPNKVHPVARQPAHLGVV